MRLYGLLPLVGSAPELRALRDLLGTASVRRTIGVADAAKPVLLAALLEQVAVPALVLTPRPDRATAMAEELALYLTKPERVVVFPEADTIPYERVTPDV